MSVIVVNAAKQAGTTECTLYALATLTCLALGSDLLAVVHNQHELRPHFVTTLECGNVVAFPF